MRVSTPWPVLEAMFVSDGLRETVDSLPNPPEAEDRATVVLESWAPGGAKVDGKAEGVLTLSVPLLLYPGCGLLVHGSWPYPCVLLLVPEAFSVDWDALAPMVEVMKPVRCLKVLVTVVGNVRGEDEALPVPVPIQ